MSDSKAIIRLLRRVVLLVRILIVCVLSSLTLYVGEFWHFFDIKIMVMGPDVSASDPGDIWQAPDTSQIPDGPGGDLIRYGKELITHTSVYLGPKGTVMPLSNGMNCQNCHLQAGTVPYGNNFARVASSYPKFRNRSGVVEGFEKRVNDCIRRSLNGTPLPSDSREMKALVAYLKWVGKDVTKTTNPEGLGLYSIALLDRAADPEKGKGVYQKYCATCHGDQGQGKISPGKNEWEIPPLAGPESYNTGAGLYRLSKFAAFVKANMPYGVTYDRPLLTDEEAWDVAAYINSLPRPKKVFAQDWPDLTKKPYDHPFGPYVDQFSENQHKYGPYQPIIESKN